MRLLDALDLACRWLCGVAILVMVAAIFGQVFARAVLDGFLTWAEEAARYAFVWMTFLGSASAFRARAHLGIDFLPGLLRERGRVALDALACAFALALGLALLRYGWALTERTWTQLSPATQIRMGLIYVAIPIGAGLIALFAAVDLVRDLRALALGDPSLSAHRGRSPGRRRGEGVAGGEAA